MKRVIRFLLPTIAVVALVSGVAVAKNSGKHASKANAAKQAGAPQGVPPGPPPGGPGGPGAQGDLVYGEMHVMKDGKEVVLRADRGEVQSVSDTEITIKESNGDTVTIAIDSDTKVLAGPGKDATTADISEGDEVIVQREDGGAAKAICLPPPKRAKPPKGAQGFGPPGPPPSQTQQDSSQ